MQLLNLSQDSATIELHGLDCQQFAAAFDLAAKAVEEDEVISLFTALSIMFEGFAVASEAISAGYSLGARRADKGRTRRRARRGR
jgi:hypothetical protein